MKYYPVSLKVEGRDCLVIGGGKVAYRKVLDLLRSGAHVRVVAPDVTDAIGRLGQKGKIKLVKRPYRRSDLGRACLVYAATDEGSTNKKIFYDAQKRKMLVNVVDAPDYCDFIMPAVLRKGRVAIAVSTDGSAPYASVLIKKRIDKFIGPEYIKLINSIIDMRTRLLEMKRKGVHVNVEQALDRLSIGKLRRYIRAGNKKAMKHYRDDFVLSITKRMSR